MPTTPAYTAISVEDFTKDTLSDADEIRAAELIAMNERFFRHIAAYPPSAEHLRSLTVELRDYDAKSGWRVLRRFLPQLESLTVHAFHHPGPYASHRDRNAVPRAVFGQWYQLFRGLHFGVLSTLTSLHIDSGAVVSEHFCAIAPYVPNLRCLRLGNDWSDRNWHELGPHDIPGRVTCKFLDAATDDSSTESYAAPISGKPAVIPSEPARPPHYAACKLSKLERVDLSGGIFTMYEVLLFRSERSPNVRYFTVNCDKSMPDYPRCALVIHIGRRAAEWACLEGIVAFGETAERIWPVAARDLMRSRKDASKAGFDKVVSLTYEQDPREPQRVIHTLTHFASELPEGFLSSLQRITWLITSRSAPAVPTGDGEEVEEGEATKLHDDEALRKLFAQFKILRSVEWVSGYPTDPFAEHDPSTWAERNVICWIPRPEQDRDGEFEAFEPVYPPRK